MPSLCRIDFVQNLDLYEIMEIELIDPDLFLKYLPQDILDLSLLEFKNMI